MDLNRKLVSTLAFCWKIERRDGAGIALTSYDSAVARNGISYRSDPGVIPSAFTRKLGMDPHNGEVAGALTSAALTEDDLALGRWDGARVTLSAMDWENAAVSPQRLIGGELGEVSISGESFSAELRGAASRLNEAVCPKTSPECRADFGDRSCRVDLSGRTVRAHVIACDGTNLQLDQSFDDRFLFGRIRYLAGANCGATSVILAVNGDVVRIRDLPKAELLPGCTVEVREGCDKRLQTCVTRFGNAANFRGEPHLPGNDLLTRYPGA
jgi:uncharacterized phage protein (TIGR02218 family)